MALIEEIFQGITKEVNQVKNRSQEMLQSFTITNQIKDLERKRTTIYIEIGRMVFAKLNKNDKISEDEVMIKVKDINKLDDEIGLLNDELSSLKAQYDPNASARQKAQAKAGYHTTPGSKCHSCQSEISTDKSFCPVCGAKVNNEENCSPDCPEEKSASDGSESNKTNETKSS